MSSEVGSSDVSLKALQQSRYFYVEGYASSSPATTAAAILCREQAHQNNVISSVSLSDPTMVEFCRDALQQILGNGVGLIFCNEEEALAWARTDRLDIAITELKDIAPELYVTLGAQGSIAIHGGSQKHAPGVPVKAVDSTGAGDIYAGACIAARCQGAEPYDAARFANHCASHIVGRYGARLKLTEDYGALHSSFS